MKQRPSLSRKAYLQIHLVDPSNGIGYCGDVKTCQYSVAVCWVKHDCETAVFSKIIAKNICSSRNDNVKFNVLAK